MIEVLYIVTAKIERSERRYLELTRHRESRDGAELPSRFSYAVDAETWMAARLDDELVLSGSPAPPPPRPEVVETAQAAEHQCGCPICQQRSPGLR